MSTHHKKYLIALLLSVVLAGSTLFGAGSSIAEATNEPSTIPGTIGWYDAATSSSLTPSTSAPTVWHDLSGQNQDLSIGTGATYTSFNGKPMIKLQDSHSIQGTFSMGSSNPTTIYMVMVPDSTTYGSSILSYVASGYTYESNPYSFIIKPNGTSNFIVPSKNNRVYSSNTLEVNKEPILVEITFDGTHVTSYLNGRAQINATDPDPGYFGATGTLRLGWTPSNFYQNFEGYIGEVVIRNTTDTTSTRQQFESYFASKWGIKNTVQSQDVWGFGDSITAGAYNGDPWPSLFQSLSYPVAHSISTRNVGAFGHTAVNFSQANSDYTSMIQPYLVSGNKIISAYGINDLTGGKTSAQVISAMTPIWADMRSRGAKVYVADLLPTTNTNLNATERNTYNSGIDTLVSNGTVDGHVRYLTDSRLTDASNTTYFSDGTHPTQAGDTVMAQIAADTLYGALPENISSTPSSSGATITWTTPANSTSQIQYGTTTSYGTTSTLDTNQVTSHSVSLTSLTGSTLYHYRILSTDYLGNSTTSSDQTFTTTVPSATTYTLTGPSTGSINAASTNFTVTPNNAYTGTITITPSGGGLSTPIVKTFSSSATPQTFTITPTATGTVTLTPSNNGSLTNPSALTYTATAVAPGAPTSVTATPGNASASVSFSAPSSNGGSAITGYTVTSIPSGGTDTNAGTTALSHTITGITNGTSYTFTVTATNTAGTSSASTASNSMTPVAPDSTPPTISITAPSAGTTHGSIAISATATDNVGVSGVQFKLDGSNLQSEDTSSPYAITWDTTGASDSSHILTAVARDAAGNTTTSSSVSVTVDNTAPVRSSASPTGTLALNTTSTSISLSTNEAATCKYSTSSGTAYSSMTPFSTTGSTTHSSTVSTANGTSYTYYVKCADTQTNTNATDYTISFTDAVDTTSPTVSLSAPLNNATVSGSSVTISATATDDFSVSGVQFKLDSSNLQAEDTSSPYSITWDTTGVIDGSHILTATARDGAGNSTTSAAVTITVDNTPPVISSISSGTPSLTAAMTTWTTDEASDSQVQYGANTSYGSTTILDTTMITLHSVSLTGLTPSTTYHYRVISKDAQGNNATSADHTFITSTSDTIPPVRSSSSPSGTLAAGTSSTTLSLTTDEASTCRYSTSANTAYGSMTSNFTTSGGITHSASISNLLNGASYIYYVRCSDAASNTNTDDYPIAFSIATQAAGGGGGGGAGSFITSTNNIPVKSTTSDLTKIPTETPTINSSLIPLTGVKKSNTPEEKMNLQKFLNWYLGSEIEPLEVDGLYGKLTTAAIKIFQQKNGLTVDGVFGKRSANKAISLMNEGNSTGTNANVNLCPNGMSALSNCTTPVLTTSNTTKF